MKKSTKAALLSALVFPGTGHLYLKKYLPGLILAGISLVALYLLMADTLDQAYRIANQIAQGNNVDLLTVEADSSAGLAGWVLLICWVLGIIDAHRLGRRADHNPAK